MVNELHPWTLDPQEAAQVQARLRSLLRLEWEGQAVETVAGVDISLKEEQANAAIVVLRLSDLASVEAVTASVPLVFPYIPGLLAFREGPAVLAAWEKLVRKPDLLMFDGQGIAHPRGVGIAAQMGLWLDRPTIGVAKSWLFGRHTEPGQNAGDSAPLLDPANAKQVIGAVLRTKAKVKPLYVSPGHRIDVPTALDFVMKCLAGYRLPETTRWAHRVAGGERIP